jgi:FixJ family two-component response regulator
MTPLDSTAAFVVHVLDDDAACRTTTADLLRSHGHDVRQHASWRGLMWQPERLVGGCLVLELHAGGRSCLDIQLELARSGLNVPLVFLTAHGDVTSCAAAMRAGAVDFLEKPAEPGELLRAVASALHQARTWGEWLAARARARECMAHLTPREREVLALVVAGRRNRAIAAHLGITERTVKAHRCHGMTKVGAESVAELMRIWSAAATAPPPAGPRSDGRRWGPRPAQVLWSA